MKLRVPILVFVGLAACRGASAGPLKDILVARQTKLDTVLKKYPAAVPAEAKAELGKALGEVLDYAAMGEAALGQEWAKLSASERKDYLAAFESLVRASSLARVDLYRVDRVEYADEVVDGEHGAVKTTVRTKDATADVAYTFARCDGRWRVVDWSVDGVSATRNYRAQFTKLLAKLGFPGLVEKLKQRRTEIEAKP